MTTAFFSVSAAHSQQRVGGIAPTPAAIDFGNVVAGSTESQTETLRNTGATDVTVSSISANGTGFSLNLNRISFPFTIGSGQSFSFAVNFIAPMVAANSSGTISVIMNPVAPLQIPMSGTVRAGSLWPKYANISFPTLQVGNRAEQISTLTNNGDTSLTISEITIEGHDFAVSSLALPFELNPQSSVDLRMTFAPKSVGLANGRVHVVSDAENPILGIPLVGGAQDIKSLPECSLSKTNKACKLVIDRRKPVAPATVQMYSNEAVTVVIENPEAYERYFLDYQSGLANLSPDVATSIVQGMLPSLGKLQIAHGMLGAPLPQPQDACTRSKIARIPAPGHVGDVVPAFQDCIVQLTARAIEIYRDLEPDIAPDSRTPNSTSRLVDRVAASDHISTFLTSEFFVSSKITAIANEPTLKSSPPDGAAIQGLVNTQRLLDAVANDLMGYKQRLADLQGFDNGEQNCETFIDTASDKAKCIFITSNPDDDTVYRNMVTRTITYSLNSLNLISYSQEAAPDPTKKRLIAAIPVNFADYPTNRFSSLRWEAAAGVFFSTLAVRSFSAAPIFLNGAIVDQVVSENVIHPTVVPFASGNYRLTNDLRLSRWKSNLYWTGAVGVNPNTVSADFASGLSLSWRSLMFSGLWHYGHDVRLTQGLHVGESLGASFKGSLSTQSYWTSSFAIGISVRIPSLTGR